MQDGIARRGADRRPLVVGGVMPLEGAVSIVVDGKSIGAIGVSGMLGAMAEVDVAK